jgi:hypothetical protein
MVVHAIEKTSPTNLVLPLQRFFLAYGGPLKFAEIERPHPTAALNISIAEVCRSLGAALASLEEMDKIHRRDDDSAKNKSHGESSDQLLRSFRELCYRLAEHFEILEKLIPKAIEKVGRVFEIERDDYFKKLSRFRRDACVICNKIKHESNRLVLVENVYPTGHYVCGFSLCHIGKDGTLQPNAALHDAKRNACSFNLALRAAICDLLEADRAAAQFCESVCGPTSETVGASKDSALHQLIGRLIQRPDIGFRFERSDNIRTIYDNGTALTFGLQPRRDTLPSPFDVKISQLVGGDGATRSFKLLG